MEGDELGGEEIAGREGGMKMSEGAEVKGMGRLAGKEA
jgi:hypothetical protein